MHDSCSEQCCSKVFFQLLFFLIFVLVLSCNATTVHHVSFLPEQQLVDDNVSTDDEYISSSCGPIDVAYLYVGRPPIYSSFPPRSLEALTSIASLLYYRTCPITVHLLLYRRDAPYFSSFQHLYDAPSAWFATDMAEHARRPLCGAPAQPPPVDFRYIYLDNQPLAQLLFGELPYNECRQKDAVLKLIMEKLLPNTVERVLVVDYDTLVIRDICMLWREAFQELKQQNFMALAPEMAPYYSKEQVGRLVSFSTDTKSWLPNIFTGLNSGVIFMNLRAMRDERWDQMWSSTIQTFYKEYHWAHPSPRWYMFALGDQNVFNYVFRQHPDHVQTISNAFNFQLYTLLILQEYNLPQLLCPHVEEIGILHGNGYAFLKEHALKVHIWMLFYHPALPDYSVARIPAAKNNAFRASEVAKMRQRRHIVAWLSKWQHCNHERIE